MNELSCVTLRKVDASKNMARQYSVAVCRDLFGTPVVVCRWGRIGRAGRSSHKCAARSRRRKNWRRSSWGSVADEAIRGPRRTRRMPSSSRAGPLRASAEVAVSVPLRQRAKRPAASGQLWLLDG